MKPALRICAHPGCPNLVQRGYCAQHHTERTRPYHAPGVQRLYKSARWLRIRSTQLAREPWCAECLRANIYTPAIDVDHIEPHHGDPAAFFRGPFQSLCHSCHSKKTAAETWGEGGQKSGAWEGRSAVGR